MNINAKKGSNGRAAGSYDDALVRVSIDSIQQQQIQVEYKTNIQADTGKLQTTDSILCGRDVETDAAQYAVYSPVEVAVRNIPQKIQIKWTKNM